MPESPVFLVEDLVRLSSRILAACAVPEEDARLTSLSLVNADQRGINSHGLLRLPLYVTALREGGINPKPSLCWTREEGNVGVLNADAALGQVAMQAAVERVKERGSRDGIAAVAVHNSSHYGAGAFWSDRLAQAGFMSVITSTTGPVVAPHGGTEKVLGTNPLTLGAPSAGTWPLTADLATSNGAYGKVIAARNEGRQLPEGWAVDSQGRPTIDPVAAAEGSMIAFGGHKGSAIAVLLEAFAASLTDATFAFDTVDIWNNPSSLMNNGHLVIGMDTAAFTGRVHTEKKVQNLQDRIRTAGPAHAPALAPGDPERLREQERELKVPLTTSTAAQLAQLAEAFDLSPVRPLVGN